MLALVTIDPASYEGVYQVSGETAFVAGDVILDLDAGTFNIHISNGVDFGFIVDGNGQVVSLNAVAATANDSTLQFNTTEVVIDPASYAGLFNITNVDNALAAGVRTVSMILGLDNYNAHISGGVDFRFNVDASGQVTSVNTVAATGSGSTLRFNTTDVTIDPDGYAGVYSITSVDSTLASGVRTISLMPGLDAYNVHISGGVDFQFNVDASTQVTSVNALAARGDGSTLTFNTTDVMIDPGGYAGVYSITSVDSTLASGARTITLMPGLGNYTIHLGPGIDIFFGVDGAGQPSPSTVSATVEGELVTLQLTAANVAPQSHAGTDQTVNEGDLVSLDGTFSDANAGDSHTYLWRVAAPNGQVVAESATESLSFMPRDNGVYTATFTVTDDKGDAGSDTVAITALNVAPSAGFSAVDAGGTITLSSSVSDPSVLDTLTYLWEVSDNGSAFLTGTGPSLVFPRAAGDIYVIRLTVSDDDGGTTLAGPQILDALLTSAPPLSGVDIVALVTDLLTRGTTTLAAQDVIALVSDTITSASAVLTESDIVALATAAVDSTTSPLTGGDVVELVGSVVQSSGSTLGGSGAASLASSVIITAGNALSETDIVSLTCAVLFFGCGNRSSGGGNSSSGGWFGGGGSLGSGGSRSGGFGGAGTVGFAGANPNLTGNDVAAVVEAIIGSSRTVLSDQAVREIVVNTIATDVLSVDGPKLSRQDIINLVASAGQQVWNDATNVDAEEIRAIAEVALNVLPYLVATPAAVAITVVKELHELDQYCFQELGVATRECFHSDTFLRDYLIYRIKKVYGAVGGNPDDIDALLDSGTQVLQTVANIPAALIALDPALTRRMMNAHLEWYLSDVTYIQVNPRSSVGEPVYYVNGMLTDRESAKAEAAALSEHLHRPVRLIHNPTAGYSLPGLLADVGQAFQDKVWQAPNVQHNDATKVVAGLFYEAAKAGESISIVAHSQGTLITDNAVRTLTALGYDNWVNSKLAFVATGPPVYSFENVAQLTVYRNVGDPIAQLVGKPDPAIDLPAGCDDGRVTDVDCEDGEWILRGHEFIDDYVKQIGFHDLWFDEGSTGSAPPVGPTESFRLVDIAPRPLPVDTTVTAAAHSANGVSGTTFQGVIASFTDTNATRTADDYRAFVIWDSGAITFGSITEGGSGEFNVLGTQLQSQEGLVPVQVVVADRDGGSTLVSSSIDVAASIQTSSQLVTTAHDESNNLLWTSLANEVSTQAIGQIGDVVTTTLRTDERRTPIGTLESTSTTTATVTQSIDENGQVIITTSSRTTARDPFGGLLGTSTITATATQSVDAAGLPATSTFSTVETFDALGALISIGTAIETATQSIDEGGGIVTSTETTTETRDPLGALTSTNTATAAATQSLDAFGIVVTITESTTETIDADGIVRTIYQTTESVANAPPEITSADLYRTSITEGSSAALVVQIANPASLDEHKLVIDWADGASDIIDLPVGVRTFVTTHDYVESSGTDTYSIIITLTDDDGGQSSDTLMVTVNNVAAQVQNLAVTSPINEGDFATLSGSIVDPGTEDTFTLEVDWGDGSSIETFNFPAGTMSFSETHQYLDDNPTATPTNTYVVSVTLADDDTESGSLLVQTGDEIVGQSVIDSLFGQHSINDAGQLVFQSNSGAKVFSLDELLFEVNDVIDGRTLKGFQTPAINDTGDVFVIGTYTSTSGPAAIFTSIGALVDTGDVVAGKTLTDIQSLAVNDGGDMVFVADFDGKRGLFSRDASGAASLLLEAGDAIDNVVLTSMLSVSMNIVGDIVFQAFLSNGNVGVFRIDETGARAVAVSGDTIDGKTLTGVGGSAINDNGDIYFHSQFLEGSGVAIFTPNSLVVQPGDVIADTTLSSAFAPAINDAGDLVFQGNFAGGQGIFLLPAVRGDTAGAMVVINNVDPLVDAGTDQAVDEGDLVSFAGTFTDPGSADTHTIEWDFGDGQTTSGSLTPSHAYADDGIYTATLTVTDDDGGQTSDMLVVTVNNVAPTLTLSGAPSVNEGSSYSLGLSSSDLGSDTITSWFVDWGDDSDPDNDSQVGEVINGNPTTVTHTYLDGPADHMIRATATDEDGAYDASLPYEFETATLGATEQVGGIAIANDQFIGARFEVTADVTITEIGGFFWTSGQFGNGRRSRGQLRRHVQRPRHARHPHNRVGFRRRPDGQRIAHAQPRLC